MDLYEKWIQEASDAGLFVIDNISFQSHAKGLIYDNCIGLSNHPKTRAEKTCVLAEELGHYYTTTGNILDQRDIRNRKQEYRARLWGYNRLVGLHSIISAYEHGCQSLYETTDFLEVTELYLKEVLTCYTGKYGVCKDFEGYRIFFEPYLHIENLTKYMCTNV